MTLLAVVLSLAGQFLDPAPAVNPSQDPPPAATPAPAPAGQDPRDLDPPETTDVAPHDDVEEADPEPVLQPGPGTPLTFLASAAGDMGTVLGCWMLASLFSPLAIVMAYIPVIGTVLNLLAALLLPASVGASGGAVAWLLANKWGKRRVPLLPLLGAGAGITCGTTVLSYIPLIGFSVLGYLLFIPPYLVGVVYADVRLILLSLAIYLGVALVGAAAYWACLAGGWVTHGVTLGLMAAKMGRQRTEDDTDLHLDLLTVPPAAPKKAPAKTRSEPQGVDANDGQDLEY